MTTTAAIQAIAFASPPPILPKSRGKRVGTSWQKTSFAKGTAGQASAFASVSRRTRGGVADLEQFRNQDRRTSRPACSKLPTGRCACAPAISSCRCRRASGFRYWRRSISGLTKCSARSATGSSAGGCCTHAGPGRSNRPERSSITEQAAAGYRGRGATGSTNPATAISASSIQTPGRSRTWWSERRATLTGPAVRSALQSLYLRRGTSSSDPDRPRVACVALAR